MPYKYLLFDADDTLYDYRTLEQIAIKTTWTTHNIPLNDSTISAFRKQNSARWEALTTGKGNWETLETKCFTDFLLAVGISVDPITVSRTFHETLLKYNSFLPGAQEIIAELKRRNYKICLCTNDVSSERFQKGLTDGLYSEIFTATRTGAFKPRKEYFEVVLETIGIEDRREVVFIGDRLSSDIQGGINAGIDTVWYNPCRKGSDGIRPTYDIADLKELLLLFPPLE
jgi:YjjG family noncanonical pyrimidine nucleotidase